MASLTDGYAKENPLVVTGVLSVIGYALVFGSFGGLVPFPAIGRETVLRFSDAIAVVNTCALTALLVGYYCIRNRRVRAHRASMLTAVALIGVFLVLYLWKVGGGFEKELVIQQGQFLAGYASAVRPLYLVMLAVHIVLSALAVPLVVHPVVLGLTHTPEELERTAHARVGRYAVATWSLSLGLGIVTYWLLNHVYSWRPL
ncbi:DUF420 domain-containing protein [Halocalculus aciditolerans]|uniref:DUF420 domain-containing protein n=1 Tax=Halocalculus aciditolerans TaxID=1383812 RepID=A0A830FL17_9EURY|nr:DUF420 domain-containing protein [Halocalculus aciditolerans]GGL66412.1 hypothetical protein GCM10009039_25470 [Halocalculus aciditolerans]